MEIKVGLILKNSEGHRIEIKEIYCQYYRNDWETYISFISDHPDNSSSQKGGLSIEFFEHYYLNSTYKRVKLVDVIDE